ncbi:hypothetical protein [Streptomyces clavuligerus]|uniref:hypothetical protein n=1 Tax=Streptomyces clavuligerus TaxID=1901 RepID=UPI0002FC7AAE|nr:hypothetical protein [Streptomyces clavuligerus]ANW20912.1 hypothetical protein BB341_23220 [Streptomyces clavuligerus]MBY6305640.1 hypothetical protein [Streptomyces clavuligerus]QPL65531.1 hypothetical protein I3J04_23520 [Streptomyces clavuligerus]QPL72365.1 hypothetical protein I3J05_28035 [Streptomyces clavuligerus]QPL77643.1 hypothetical protein I3J06_23535 [Streptomyces clavuligerus]
MRRIGITGHRFIPREALDHIRVGLRTALHGHTGAGALQAYSSLAVGADQLFADLALEHGAELTAVIPSGNYTEDFGAPGELARFEELRGRAAREVRLGFPRSTGEAYYAAGAYIADHCDRLLAVWDGAPARGLGGTADIVRYAREQGVPVTVIWRAGLERP